MSQKVTLIAESAINQITFSPQAYADEQFRNACRNYAELYPEPKKRGVFTVTRGDNEPDDREEVTGCL